MQREHFGDRKTLDNVVSTEYLHTNPRISCILTSVCRWGALGLFHPRTNGPGKTTPGFNQRVAWLFSLLVNLLESHDTHYCVVTSLTGCISY